jgi:hypothetical protein
MIVMVVITVGPDPYIQAHPGTNCGLMMVIMATAVVVMMRGHDDDPGPIVVVPMVIIGHGQPRARQKQNTQQTFE